MNPEFWCWISGINTAATAELCIGYANAEAAALGYVRDMQWRHPDWGEFVVHVRQSGDSGSLAFRFECTLEPRFKLLEMR